MTALHSGLRLWVLLCGLAAGRLFAATWTVDAPGKLATIAGQIQAASSGGTHVVLFKTYKDVGAFSLNGLTADSLIFIRAEESAEVVEFTGTLFQMRNVTAAVVFRNLAFKAKNGSSIFIDGVATGSPNRNLVIDSCQIFADSLNTTFLAWSAETATGTTLTIKRSIISGAMGSKGNIDVTADTVRVANCYFNYSGMFVGKSPKRAFISNSTFNRIQFDLSGKITGAYSIQSNLFGHPPLQDKLSGIKNVFVMSLASYSTGTALNNGRFSTWYGFNLPSDDGFSDPSNTVLPAFGDSAAVWDFRQSGEIQRGYQNPVSAGFPAYSVFPGESIFKARLSERDSVLLNFETALIPRVVTASFGTVTYPAAVDSTRSLWLKDSTLRITGPVKITSMVFPKADAQGTPILFAESAGSFVPGTSGPEGTNTFINTVPGSRLYIPAFSGQNTPRGAEVAVKGLSADTALLFTTVARAGRTGFQEAIPETPRKRWRILRKGTKPFGFRATTTAEGSGEISFGLGKASVDAPFTSDSLSWWLPGEALAAVTDSGGKYWGKIPYSKTSQAVMIERLAIGPGGDTLALSQGRLIASGAVGHQATADSSFQPTVTLFPNMGSFSKGLSFKWPGRAPGDTLILEFRRAHRKEKIFTTDGHQAQPVSILREDAGSIAVALGVGDSGKILFLGRQYAVPAGVLSNLVLGVDTVKEILSSTPGDFALDTAVSLAGLKTDSLRILSKKLFVQDKLALSSPYTVVLKGPSPNRPENLRAFARRGGKWDSIAVTYANGYFRFRPAPGDSAVVVAEILIPVDTLPATDTLPITPSLLQGVSVVGNRWSFKPNLTASEKSRMRVYHLRIHTLDAQGRAVAVQASSLPGDTTYSEILASGKLQAITIGFESFSGKITWSAPMLIEGDQKSFTESLNAEAPTLKKHVYELVGFPCQVDVDEVIRSRIAGPRKDISLSEWQGKWVDVAGPSLKPKQGFLLGLHEDFKPSIPQRSSWKLATDTIVLDSGWQLVSSPLPFPHPERLVEFDPSVISWFYTLSWEGSGPTAVPKWSKVDSFHPFKGYAVYATRKTKLIFDPWKSFSLPQALAKAASIKTLALHFEGPQSGQMEITIHPGQAMRPTPRLPFWNPIRSLSWDAPAGAISKAAMNLDILDEVIVLQVPHAETFTLRLDRPDGIHYALWDAQTETLVALEGVPSVRMAAGQNWLRILAVAPEDLAATEARLKSESRRDIVLLPFHSGLSKSGKLGFEIPMALGQMDHVDILGVSIDGRKKFKKSLRNVVPGRYDVTVDLNETGALYVLFEFRGPRDHKRLQTKIMSLGGGR